MCRDSGRKPYPEVEPQPRFPEIEERVLESWRRDRTFRASVEARPPGEGGKNEYVFYDGPPFANGLPHMGHFLTGYVKDIVPRYQTLRGHRVERRFGWDCHGLPVEMEAEKELEVTGRKQILDYGVGQFNDYCRSTVLRYSEAWEEYVTRQARWVDFRNDYKTMDLPYMESVLWAFKELWKKGLVYEDYKVMPYSWACQTPLSNFETRQDDSYRERQDPAITVRFELLPEAGDDRPTDLLAWTTTPWTLPSNLALAVGPEIEYAVFEKDGRRSILGAALVPRFEKELEGAAQVGTVLGSSLAGRRYRPLFPFFADTENAFRVLAADFVDTEEGTGVVHMAPGFGEDDMEACGAAGIPVVVPVDDAGCFTALVPDYAGQLVLDANPQIIRDLKERGLLVRHETILHNYPHCWRTDEPLIYRAQSSWYVKVTAFRERMVELNQQINWIPERVRDGLFGNWLEGARDWAISRNRFWGTPIPIWKSDDPEYPRIDVYGSFEDFERDFGAKPSDLHRPTIDDLVRPNPDDPSGRSMMRRIPDVLDGWFESGSMPFAQVHYPFENREWFENHFPADFIVEYVAQTRGWFYTLMVLGTALFDRPPFRNCMCHGVILAEDGQKVSKRLRNYKDPEEIFRSEGSDALRWFLVASPVLRGANLRLDREGKAIADVVRSVLNPLWNAWSFFALYANVDGIRAESNAGSGALLDRYILAKAHELVVEVQSSMDAYDLAGACGHILTFLDALTNWYIRRSRQRFWKSEQDQDKRQGYDTLFTVLETLCRVASPLLPFVSEEIWRGLTGGRSVHLTDWPDAESLPSDPELVTAMDRVRDTCSAARMLREGERVRVRQPLRRLTVAGADVENMRPFVDLLADEVNVKEVDLTSGIEAFATFRLQVNARQVGPRLGGAMKGVLAAAKQGQWKPDGDNRVVVDGQVLGEGEFSLLLEPKEGVACRALPSNDAIVVLDLDLDADLVSEGWARDLVRAVQQARKEAGLHVSDRIRLSLELSPEWREAAQQHRAYLEEQTLALEIELDGGAEGSFRQESRIGDETVVIALERI